MFPNLPTDFRFFVLTFRLSLLDTEPRKQAKYMTRNRGPPITSPGEGYFSVNYPHFLLDKQRARAVLLNHDKRYKSRKNNDLRGMQYRLPTLWQTSKRAATLPLPTVRQDVHRRSHPDSGHDVYF